MEDLADVAFTVGDGMDSLHIDGYGGRGHLG